MRGCENDVRIQLFLMYLSHVHKTPDAFVIKVIKTDLTMSLFSIYTHSVLKWLVVGYGVFLLP